MAYRQYQSSGSAGNGKTAVRWVLRILSVILILILFIVLALFGALKMAFGSTSQASKELLTTTFLETGAFKFIPSIFLSDEEIKEIVDANSMQAMTDSIDSSLISIDSGNTGANTSENGEEVKDIEVFKVTTAHYEAKILKVKDPSRVSLATIFPWNNNSWPSEGVTLDVLVKENGAVGGINGGIYNSFENTGGKPFGVVVSNGEIQMNDPSGDVGYVLIGLTDENILEVFSIEGMTPGELEATVKEKHIRDAVTFQEEKSDANNHFVQLVINGEARKMNGAGSGRNPRTAIGQCADGSLLLLVTDGRASGGHDGATASDLVEIMMEYGAVNAANLDGGSSTCMFYNDEWLQTSVTLYYSNASWRLPFAFIVK